MEGYYHLIQKEEHACFPFRHEAGIRRELIQMMWSIEEEFVNTMNYLSMFFIVSSSHDKQHVFSLTLD
jgi:hypothetical protein